MCYDVYVHMHDCHDEGDDGSGDDDEDASEHGA